MPKKFTKDPWSTSFTTVTPFSKAVALALFILFPIIAFCLGIIYGQAQMFQYLLQSKPPEELIEQPNPVACTMDAMLCPDGSYVGRTGPNCEFICPNL